MMVHNQERSRLLSLPLEVRDDIYTYLVPDTFHVFLRQGEFAFTRCLKVEVEGFLVEKQYPSGEEYPTILDHVPDQGLRRRRLLSTWGPHFQCEEITQETVPCQSIQAAADNVEATMAILLVCRTMFADVCRALSGNVTYHVTDLETLDRLAHSESISQTSSCSWTTLSVQVPSISNLGVTLQLPLAPFQAAAEYPEGSGSPESPEMQSISTGAGTHSLLTTWTQIWPALAGRMEKLQHLRVWLDHDDKRPWALVHERAIVSRITTAICPTNCPSLKVVTINLPKLFPGHESPSRHFMKGSERPPPFVRLNRRVRHLYEEISDGHITVTYEFPALFEMAESLGELLLEHVEDAERELIAGGVDPMDVTRGWGGGT
ncbi:hypothetical protein GE09DRAFT_4889 [Coniochaeta sp. 2T2.1]|nr:hypothetical protein GE09DRAFT_4889 [Coniochaeta sp. 2T2.1]